MQHKRNRVAGRLLSLEHSAAPASSPARVEACPARSGSGVRLTILTRQSFLRSRWKAMCFPPETIKKFGGEIEQDELEFLRLVGPISGAEAALLATLRKAAAISGPFGSTMATRSLLPGPEKPQAPAPFPRFAGGAVSTSSALTRAPRSRPHRQPQRPKHRAIQCAFAIFVLCRRLPTCCKPLVAFGAAGIANHDRAATMLRPAAASNLPCHP